MSSNLYSIKLLFHLVVKIKSATSGNRGLVVQESHFSMIMGGTVDRTVNGVGQNHFHCKTLEDWKQKRCKMVSIMSSYEKYMHTKPFWGSSLKSFVCFFEMYLGWIFLSWNLTHLDNDISFSVCILLYQTQLLKCKSKAT